MTRFTISPGSPLGILKILPTRRFGLRKSSEDQLFLRAEAAEIASKAGQNRSNHLEEHDVGDNRVIDIVKMRSKLRIPLSSPNLNSHRLPMGRSIRIDRIDRIDIEYGQRTDKPLTCSDPPLTKTVNVEVNFH